LIPAFRARVFSPFISRVLPPIAAVLLLSFSFWQFSVAAQSNAGTSHEFDRFAAEAAQARDANDLEKAIPLYRKALRLRPGWAEGWWSLGTLFYDSDKYEEAAAAFSKVVSLQPKHGSARVMLGLCEFELRQDENALRDIESGKKMGVLSDSQLRQVMLYHEGVLLLRKERYEAAQQALDSLAEENVQDDNLLLALGESVLRMKPDGAPPEGSTAREIVMREGKAEYLAASKNVDGARAEYSNIAAEFPESPNVHYALGRFLLQLHEIDPAVVEFQREIQNNPEHVLARLEIAAARYRLDSAGGVKYAEEAVKLDPQRPFGHYLLGLLYLDTGNFAQAVFELQTAKRARPNMPEVYFALGKAYAKLGRKEEAAKARAEFRRLQAQQEKEPGPEVYGQQRQAVPQEKDEPQQPR